MPQFTAETARAMQARATVARLAKARAIASPNGTAPALRETADASGALPLLVAVPAIGAVALGVLLGVVIGRRMAARGRSV